MVFLNQGAERTKMVSLLKYELDHGRCQQAFQGLPSPAECNPETASGPVGPAVCVFSFSSSPPCSLWSHLASRVVSFIVHVTRQADTRLRKCTAISPARHFLQIAGQLPPSWKEPSLTKCLSLFGHIFLVTAIHHLIYFCLSVSLQSHFHESRKSISIIHCHIPSIQNCS